MIMLDPLEQVLTGPGARELAFDDPTLDEMLSLANRGRFVQAGEKAEQLWRQQVYDVRTLGCYLLGVFSERGISSLGPILGCIHRALSSNLAYMSPHYKRERQLDVALRFLFDSIVSQVRFHERQKDPVWKKWNDEWLQRGQEQAAERCTLIVASLDERIPNPSCKQPLLHLQSLLQGLGRKSTASAEWNLGGGTMIPEPPPPPDPAESSSSGQDSGDAESQSSSNSSSSSKNSSDGSSSSGSSSDSASSTSSKGDDDDSDKDDDKGDDDKEDDKEDDDKDDDDKDDDDKKSDGSQKSASSSSTPAPRPSPESPSGSMLPAAGAAGPALTIMPSLALQELVQQLAGFVFLVQAKRYRRAGILLRLLRQNLQSFDPTRYFPSLFTDYLIALSRNAGRFNKELSGESDLESETLQKLCAADLGRFLGEE